MTCFITFVGQILRRTSDEEKVLCLVRRRPGHTCDASVQVLVVVVWDGLDLQHADALYDYLKRTLPRTGADKTRRRSSGASTTPDTKLVTSHTCTVYALW